MARAEQVPTKSSFEEKLISFDLSNELTTAETVSSATVSANPAFASSGGLTKIGSETISGQIVQVKVGEGTAGTEYDLICQATTSYQKIEQVGTLIVEEDS